VQQCRERIVVLSVFITLLKSYVNNSKGLLRFNENSGYTIAQHCYDQRILPALFISDVANVEFKIARLDRKKDM
jgi:hypothetical protein